jgi:serine/threonine protein kinase
LLGDFGIAANLEADDTAAAAGNQRCRAPEGFGGRLSRQSDLYSAGATLWRLLVGEWPYDAATEAELAGKMRGQDRPRLRDIAPHIHRSIAAVVERALDPDPKSRPVSASDMARDLAQTRLHNRNWVRVKPDAGVEAAFQSTGGASSLVVEMRGDGSRASIVTRHASSGRRVLAGCVETTASRVRIELRKLFDSV